MPQQMYSLPEQLFRLAGVLASLPRRECFVKIGHQPALRTRTTDLQPAFASAFAKRIALPIFTDLMRKHSPYVLPAAQVDADVARRLAVLTPPPTPEPDLTKPEPLPIVDAPEEFAASFWSNRTAPLPDPPNPKPKKPRPGRKPIGDLPPDASRFTVIDGGDGDNKT
jgi:hypothetical protein